MHSINRAEYLEAACEIASEAAQLLMRFFTEGYELSRKTDKSPVTSADLAANRLIVEKLAALDAAIPIIAEEDDELGGAADRFWLVDPLDGTRAFVEGEPEFTVNIGLIEHGEPVLGVIVLPPEELSYYGGEGLGAWRKKTAGPAEKIAVRTPPAGGLTVVRSKSHPSARTSTFLETLKVADMIPGSSSIKFCKVADGSADLYPRFGRTMEWDTAAGHAILNAAGGRVVVAETGEHLRYGKQHFENPHFIAWGA